MILFYDQILTSEKYQISKFLKNKISSNIPPETRRKFIQTSIMTVFRRIPQHQYLKILVKNFIDSRYKGHIFWIIKTV